MSKEIEIRNARISHTFLGIEDHGIFTFLLHLDYNGAGQSAGGFVLDIPNATKNHIPENRRRAKALEILWRILKLVGVDNWEELKGKYIKVKSDYNRVYAIANILGDNWLNFQKFFEDEK